VHSAVYFDNQFSHQQEPQTVAVALTGLLYVPWSLSIPEQAEICDVECACIIV